MATGLQAAGIPCLDQAALTGHAGLGIAGTIILSVLFWSRYSANVRHDSIQQPYRGVWLALEVLATVLILLAALTGHGIGR